MTNTYRHRNETGHLVEVALPPPLPEQAILQAYAAVFHGSPPDSWQAALAELQRAAAAQGTHPAPIAAPSAPLLYDAERWETL